VREAHWADALALRDASEVTAVFGMGVARFPETHFFRSREATRAGPFRVVEESGLAYLRLGAGAPGYIDQIIELPDEATLRVEARLRSAGPQAALTVSVCEKWMLTSLRCAQAQLLAAAQPGQWGLAKATMGLGPLRAGGIGAHRMLKFALHTPTAGGSVDVDDVRLLTADGQDLLANGDFGQGLARWLYTTDVDPPWHIHSLPVALLFDQGWFGLLAMAGFVALGVVRGARSALQGEVLAGAAWAGLAAFMVSGSLNTLVDEPRFVFLLLVLGWLAARPSAPAARQSAVRPGMGLGTAEQPR
jgi:hypothetical protein